MRRGADLIGRMPDELLQHVLSLLPSRDAVQSSLLSRRWRDLWKSAPAVRVTGKGQAFRLFVDSLLLHRNDAAQLRSFEIDHVDDGLFSDDYHYDYDYDYYDYDYDYDYGYDFEDGEHDELLIPCKSKKIDPSVDRWIEHALSTCRATSLTARFDEGIGVPWQPRPNAFASQHLTTMHLELVYLAGGLLDFSPCPALLSLTISGCRLNGDALLSPSLERLSIIHCDIPIGRYTDGGTKTMRISTPNLRHLNISDGYDGEQTAPSLDRMPWLTTANIQLTGATRMYPGNTRDGCSLLHGLSEATTLELIASTQDTMEIVQRDLTWCPTFTKLKTLILNKWCVYANVSVLCGLLRYTPTIERLILRLDFEEHDAFEEKTEGSYITSQQLLPTLENLKTVEIERHCPYYDTRDHEILKCFTDSGIPSSKKKKCTPSSSAGFNG